MEIQRPTPGLDFYQSRYLFPVTKAGHLFKCVDKHNAGKPADQRITFLAEITPAHLTQ